MPPKLLISVRSAEECQLACAAGVDLVDIKEPRRGSLGFAGAITLDEVAAALAELAAPSPPLSVALGELDEWPDDRPLPSLPEGVTFAKIGLSRCRGRGDWIDRWRHLRTRFDTAAPGSLSWIAVCYADRDAQAPSFEETLEAARQTGCAGLLLDTFDKSAGGLLDHRGERLLAAWGRRVRRAGLLFAVAGGLAEADLPRIRRITPDIVALRGAACAGPDRAGPLDRVAITRLGARLSSS